MSDLVATVVIPARDAESVLTEQLDALVAQVDVPPFEVVVIDDGSTDGTAAVASSFADRLTLRVLPGPGAGPAAARNAGAALAKGRYLLFCDADDRVGPSWVRSFCAALDAGADAAGSDVDDLTLNTPSSVAWRGTSHCDGLAGWPGFLPFAISASLAVRRDTGAELGGFDAAEFGRTCEDVDLSWRIQLAGGALAYADGATIAYRYRPDLRRSVLQAYGYGREEARLYRRFRGSGMVRRPFGPAMRTLAWCALEAVRRSDDRRGTALVLGARRLGAIVGGIRLRVAYW